MNPFLTMTPEDRPLPIYEEIKDRLPKPVWEGHSDVSPAITKRGKLRFRNLRRPNAEAGFVSNFIDTAFNGYLFMWDSSFIVMFGRYANHIFNFQKTLDNFIPTSTRTALSAGKSVKHRTENSSTGTIPLQPVPTSCPGANGNIIRLREKKRV